MAQSSQLSLKPLTSNQVRVIMTHMARARNRPICKKCGRLLNRYSTCNHKTPKYDPSSSRRLKDVGNIKFRERRIIICPICQRPKRPIQDHDHASGTFRSKICQQCNTGLGLFLDDPDLLTRASEYLKYWKSKDLFEKWKT